MSKSFSAGTGMTVFGSFSAWTGRELFTDAGLLTLKDAGTSPEEIDEKFYGNFAGTVSENQGHQGPIKAFVHCTDQTVESACVSSGLAVRDAVHAVRSGEANVVIASETKRISNMGAADATDAVDDAMIGLTHNAGGDGRPCDGSRTGGDRMSESDAHNGECDEFLDAFESGNGYYYECSNGHGILPLHRIYSHCGDRNLKRESLPATGKITTYTTVTVLTPRSEDDEPYVTAIATFKLVRLIGIIRGVDQDDVEISEEVTVTVELNETTDNRTPSEQSTAERMIIF